MDETELVYPDEEFEWKHKSETLKAYGYNINNVWRIITTNFKTGEWTTSKYIALKIIKQKKLPVDPDAIWGGPNRRRYLFPLIYHPLRWLEKEGYIAYNRKGDLSRLR